MKSTIPWWQRARRILEERRITQRELADAVGISGPYVSQLLTGVRTPSMDTIKKIAEFLGVSLTELVEGDPSIITEPAEKLIIQAWRKLDESEREIVRRMVVSLAGDDEKDAE